MYEYVVQVSKLARAATTELDKRTTRHARAQTALHRQPARFYRNVLVVENTTCESGKEPRPAEIGKPCKGVAFADGSQEHCIGSLQLSSKRQYGLGQSKKRRRISSQEVTAKANINKHTKEERH
jgi:hypothetical protein